MPVYATAVVGYGDFPGSYPKYVAKVVEANSFEEAIGLAVQYGYQCYPACQILAPAVVEVKREELLLYLKHQGLCLTYDQKAVKELILEGLEAMGPEGKDSFKDRQFVRIAHALGIDLSSPE